MTNILAELPLIRSRRVQVLPPKFHPIVGERIVEATDQDVTVDSHVEGNLFVEYVKEFTSYNNPLVEQPHATHTTFHFPMEGRAASSNWVFNHPSDHIVGVEFGPNYPF